MQTLLVPVVAQLPALLGTATSNAAWVITATLLSGAVATPIMGRLGDLYGKRRMTLVSLGLMVAGSLVCGVTSSLVPMVAGRVLQGFGMGAIPLGISIMRDELRPERLGSAMAFMSSSLGVGGALGMPLAAYVAQHTDWHALFFGAAGLGALAMALVLWQVPESAHRAHGRFDVLGALGLSAGLVALLLPVSKGGDWGWGSPLTLGLLALAVVLFLLWGVFELRTTDPLVDLRTTARRQVLLTNLASITVGLAFYAATLVLPQLLQLPPSTGYGLGQSMLVAGLCVAPMGLAMMMVSSLSARISAARGPKVSLMTGLVLLAVAYLAGTLLMDAAWQVVITAVLIGVGIGIAYSAMPALIIGAVPQSESGAANGLNTLMRSIGTSTSSAVIGVVLARMTIPLGDTRVPDISGFRTAFLIAAGAALLGLLIAAFLPGRSAGRREDAPEEAPSVPEPVARTAVPDREVRDGVLHGTVCDEAGEPLPHAVLTLLDHAGRQLSRAAADADGTWTLWAASHGSRVLVAAAPGHLPEAATVTVAGGGPVRRDLVLRPGVAVRGAVRTPAGRPLGDVRVSLADRSGTVVGTHTTGADGAYVFTGLAEGAYTIVAHGYGAAAVPVSVDGGAVHTGHDIHLGHESEEAGRVC
ncbi:MFS transporter [Streptomyces sp. HNM0574]|uniref:MFS transporter n=1 Tax=Streptomyces sp. HNM0574 TaxID=2714954 RepID=UPI001F11519E|nr:MFS transporter [Streptomyces sp. HNM0574]